MRTPPGVRGPPWPPALLSCKSFRGGGGTSGGGGSQVPGHLGEMQVWDFGGNRVTLEAQGCHSDRTPGPPGGRHVLFPSSSSLSPHPLRTPPLLSLSPPSPFLPFLLLPSSPTSSCQSKSCAGSCFWCSPRYMHYKMGDGQRTRRLSSWSWAQRRAVKKRKQGEGMLGEGCRHLGWSGRTPPGGDHG